MPQNEGASMFIDGGGALEVARQVDEVFPNAVEEAMLNAEDVTDNSIKQQGILEEVYNKHAGFPETVCSSTDLITNIGVYDKKELEASLSTNEDAQEKEFEEKKFPNNFETAAITAEAEKKTVEATVPMESIVNGLNVDEAPDVENSEATSDYLEEISSSIPDDLQQNVLPDKELFQRPTNVVCPEYVAGGSNVPYSSAQTTSTVSQQASAGSSNNVAESLPIPSTNTVVSSESTNNTNPFQIPVPARLGKIEVKLFVGRLPRVIEESQLTPLFAPFGEVVESVIIRDKASRMHKGSAFVKMASLTEADAAVRALHNVKVIDPQLGPIQVKYANGEPERLGLTMDAAQAGHDLGKLFVGSLPRTISEAEVRQIFECFGRIDEVVLMKDSSTGQPKGCAFVKFTYKEMAIHAIKALHGQVTLPGCPRALEVKFAENRRAAALPTTAASAPQMAAAPPIFLHGPKTSATGPPMPSNTGMRMAGTTQQASPPSNLNPRTAGGWAEYFTADGKPYYHHTMTKTTQWTKPLEFERATTPYSQGGTAGTLSMYNPIGSSGPPGANVFVFHIPNEWGQNEVVQHFSQFGRVLSCYVATDRITGRNKGYGFISYDDVQSAANAVLGMNGFPVNSKRLKVSIKSGEESYAAHLLGGHMHGHQQNSAPPSMMVPSVSASAQHAGSGTNYAPVGMFHTSMSAGAPPSAGNAALLGGTPTAAGLGSYRSTPY